jgi:hypothetical protein
MDEWNCECIKPFEKVFRVEGRCSKRRGQQYQSEEPPYHPLKSSYVNKKNMRWDAEKYNWKYFAYGACWVEFTRFYYDKIKYVGKIVSTRETFVKPWLRRRRYYCYYTVKVEQFCRHFYKGEILDHYDYSIKKADCK